MKNTLLTKDKNSFFSLLESSPSLKEAATKCASLDEKSREEEEKKVFPLQVYGIKGSLSSFFIRLFIKSREEFFFKNAISGKKIEKQKDTLIIVPTQKESDECEIDLKTAFEDSVDIYTLPWWGSVPYRPSAKGSAIFGERAGVISHLASKNPFSKKPRIFILTQRSFLTPLPPPQYTKSLITHLKKGDSFDPEELSDRLSFQGYIRVPKIGMKGEFVLRGEVLEVFMTGEEVPIRIVFDFDTIIQIKTFSPETQTSIENLESVMIYPRKEVIWSEDFIALLEGKLEEEDKSGIKNSFASYDKAKKGISPRSLDDKSEKEKGENENSENGLTDTKNIKNGTVERERENQEKEDIHLSFTEEAKKEKDRIIFELSEKGETEGEENFYPVLFDKKYSVFDYLDKDTEVFFFDWDRLLNLNQLLLKEYTVSYRLARQVLPVFRPSEMQNDFISLISSCSRLIAFRTLETSGDTDSIVTETVPFSSSLTIKSSPGQSYFGNITFLKEQLSSFLSEGYSIFIFSGSENQAARIGEILSDFTDKNLQILPLPITSGFILPDEKILTLSEGEVFGRKKSAPKSISRAKSSPIDTFVELSPGDFVVHASYGIGLFKGIERVKAMGTERDYIKLEYAEEEFAFVPIEQVNMVQRYIGGESEKPRLDRIGSKSWASRKARVQEKVRETAEKLIDLYSKRKASRGFPFPKDTEWSSAFEAAFPYEDTQDQVQATVDVKIDMEKPVPMDRLVCGDVGYGKTEIAFRAAFKAAMGGKQTAFLAPTTILSEQHFETCSERFRNFPVTVAQLSRFVPQSEQKKILEKLSKGEIDILIGTHRILQKDIHFRDLGLLIIDEEQRFGVKDKEKLKTLKTNIDCLSLSATPIPRTLHMGLLKIRDMSLLTTPPKDREAIETVIEEYSDERVAKAIRSEARRGGQIFFLHNRVESLEETRRKVENLVPELLVESAHGQMTGDELEEVFRRFKSGGFHVLVSTSIIENGIDIPNVNTIIIDRADMYGVSQLYQLRGRVGRSDRKAFAFLFYPKGKPLSEVAMRRLQVISDFTELGSGFKIAMKDMEIRGAGNLLGSDQSGEVCAVGFEMYLSLLNAAIERLSKSDWKPPREVLLELEYSGFIPDSYITDPQTKMEIYKKIASVQREEELEEVRLELSDRFGPEPEEVKSLLSLARIRVICNRLSVSSLKEKGGEVRVEFSPDTTVNIDRILSLIKTGAGRVKLDPSHPDQLILKTGTINLTEKSDFIREKLEQLE